tara:strand:+ start:1 stop:684 length:684 start_codon:yes stop_codon:yes gene_type:complete
MCKVKKPILKQANDRGKDISDSFMETFGFIYFEDRIPKDILEQIMCQRRKPMELTFHDQLETVVKLIKSELKTPTDVDVSVILNLLSIDQFITAAGSRLDIIEPFVQRIVDQAGNDQMIHKRYTMAKTTTGIFTKPQCSTLSLYELAIFDSIQRQNYEHTLNLLVGLPEDTRVSQLETSLLDGKSIHEMIGLIEDQNNGSVTLLKETVDNIIRQSSTSPKPSAPPLH